jgi:hypothetical protein
VRATAYTNSSDTALRRVGGWATSGRPGLAVSGPTSCRRVRSVLGCTMGARGGTPRTEEATAAPDAIGGESATSTALDQFFEQGMVACLAEYQTLVAEMKWLREEAAQYQRLSVTLFVGLVPLLSLLASNSPDLLIPTLLATPFPFGVLGYLFFRQHEEVYVIAAYIHEEVRPQIRRLAALPAIWGWEEFKDTRFVSGRRGVLGLLNSGKMPITMRILLFLLPAVVSTTAAAAVVLERNPSALLVMYGWAVGGLAVAAFLFDVLLIVGLVGFLWTQGDLATRVLAMRSPHSHAAR